MKKILIFYPSFERGGVEKILENLCIFFSKKKKLVYLITNKKSIKIIKKKNIKIIPIRKINKFPFKNRVILSILSLFVLKDLMKKLDAKDTVILSMQSNFFPTILSFFLKFKIFVRVSEDPCGATKFADNKIFALFVMFSKFITYNLCDRLIVNGQKSFSCVKKFTFKKKKIRLLYNPSLSKIEKKNKLKKNNYFLNVGRFCKQKNQSFLINAFYSFCKTNKEYKLILCGDGPDKERLKAQVQRLNLKGKVIFVSWKKNLKNIYKKSKLFILTSYYEGMPNVLIESINYETPVISTKASGVDDILLYGKGGLILKKMEINELVSKIKFSLENYDKILNRTFLSKKELKKYSVEKAAQKYIDYLSE
tara:strand:- start:5178 stop:6272 length:1095 start_codon:yes stop_codon:yes gene_type:complete